MKKVRNYSHTVIGISTIVLQEFDPRRKESKNVWLLTQPERLRKKMRKKINETYIFKIIILSLVNIGSKSNLSALVSLKPSSINLSKYILRVFKRSVSRETVL